MKFSSYKEFAVLLFSEKQAKGCLFKRRAGHFELKAHAAFPIEPNDPADAWKKLRHELGYGRDCPVILSGSMNNGVFFRTAIPDMPPKAQKEALLFELPQVLPRNTENDLFQFVKSGESAEPENKEISLNVYAFTSSDLEKLTALVSQNLRKVDFFIYPFLALRDTDAPAFVPETESDFYFEAGQWRPRAALDENWTDWWTGEFKKWFLFPDLPPSFVREYFGCLLTARLVASENFKSNHYGLNVLPGKILPSRLRNQLRIFALLVFLLLCGVLWKKGGSFLRESRELSRLEAEQNNLDNQIRRGKQSLKTMERELKELNRVLNQDPGEEDIIGKLADLSRVLPSNVMVQSLRWSDSALDLTLRSEAENLNMPDVLRPLKYWKISQLQQRTRNNEAGSTITLKLIPAGEGDTP